MANSKLFDIVGHLDLVKVFGYKPKKNIKDIAKNAIKAIKKANMSVELNTAGLRKKVNEIYPSNELLEMVLNEGINLTLSSDAHSIEQVGFKIDETLNKLKQLGVSELAIYKDRKKFLVKV